MSLEWWCKNCEATESLFLGDPNEEHEIGDEGTCDDCGDISVVRSTPRHGQEQKKP